MNDENIESPHLFDRVVGILESARKDAYRSINHTMVSAYWHIGREILEYKQHG